MENTVEYIKPLDLSCNVYLFNGIAGPEGPVGKMGPDGHVGPDGPEGPIGKMGPEGPVGKMGQEGSEGPIGKPGIMGPVGPIGLLQNYCDTFINAYSMTEQRIQSGNPVIFESQSVLRGNCAHLPNTDEIWIWRSGYYNVYISIYTLEACQFSVLKNATAIVPNSTIGNISGGSQTTTSFIMNITDDDIITQTNNSPFGVACKIQLVSNIGFIPHITLVGAASSGYTIPQTTATITIMLLK